MSLRRAYLRPRRANKLKQKGEEAWGGPAIIINIIRRSGINQCPNVYQSRKMGWTGFCARSGHQHDPEIDSVGALRGSRNRVGALCGHRSSAQSLILGLGLSPSASHPHSARIRDPLQPELGHYIRIKKHLKHPLNIHWSGG